MTIRNPVLIRFRAALDSVYAGRLDRVILFGSRARGDARPDSDYDVAVFLKDLPNRWAESDRIAALATDVMDETARSGDRIPNALLIPRVLRITSPGGS